MNETYGQHEARALRETIASMATIIDDKQVVQVSVRMVYGVPSIYPVNEAAKIFAAIAGTKTIQTQTLAKAKALGYRIDQVADVGQQLAYYPALAALTLN
jgi:glutamate formiminotransferase